MNTALSLSLSFSVCFPSFSLTGLADSYCFFLSALSIPLLLNTNIAM